MMPRGQGGKSDPRNGLPLCGPWSQNTIGGCHQLKTDGRIVIEPEWLEQEQIEFLAAVGWVRWNEAGQPEGLGWRHFGEWKDRVEMAEQNLGEAAQAGLGGLEEFAPDAEPILEGTDYTKVKFVGVQYDALDEKLALGDEVACMVRGRVVSVGDKVMNDGHVRHEVSVKVSSVVLDGEVEG